jgi:hypothetical protein
VTNDSAIAVGALRGKGLNCALETVEDVIVILDANDEALVVVVATHFTASHLETPYKDVVFGCNGDA